ncbi:MAG TPA: class I SAM-dependent methyltransferase [Caulobacterales bacterium]|nr:class I SAM-dependent methyltransferase [Caulobacterales bacterium]
MQQPDPAKMDAVMGRVLGDIGATASMALAMVGDRLGIFKALADGKPVTPASLAKKTGLNERYLREWLSAMAAADYIAYDAATKKFHLPAEQSAALAQEGGPAFFGGAFDLAQALFLDAAKIENAFKNGGGVGWHEHSPCLFRGTERFFRPAYNANLISSWIPSLDGVEEKLKTGAKVADVGCGHGASTILMAQSYPKSRFFGFDYHAPSVARAKAAAKDAGLDNVSFAKAAAKDFPAKNYDLIAFFDCLHDMGDPVGAGAHVKETLAPNGAWMIVEPFAHDDLAQNLNPIGRVYYAASTMICTPASLSQEVGLGLGAQAGEKRLKAVVKEAGFKKFRRAAETPFNMVFEARA